jgi:SAM-dependent methyltransferase
MNTTVQAYENKSQVYHDEVEEFWRDFPQSTVDDFVKKLKGKKVLDLGSGSGRDAVILRDKGLEVVCLDAAAAMVKMTSDLGFESIQIDFEHMQFPDDDFDGVWAYTSLLHVKKEEAQRTISKIHKFLKPEGVFLIGMIEGEFEGDLEREGWEGANRYFRFYSDNELTEMVTAVGFKKVFEERYKPHSKTYLSQVYLKASDGQVLHLASQMVFNMPSFV